MYAVYYNGRYEVFDSLLEAEEFVETVYNTIRNPEDVVLEIEPYHWTMG